MMILLCNIENFQIFPFFTLLHDRAWFCANPRKLWRKLIFHKFLHQKITILLYKIDNFSNFFLFLPFCMIEPDFVPIQENDEESKFSISFYIKKWLFYNVKLKIFQKFTFFYPYAWFCANPRKWWKKLIFHKFLHQKMTILLYEIENFSKFSLFLPFCMIEHDYMSI